MRWTRTGLNLISLGLTSAVAQVVLLRECMATLSGSELAWGLVLSLWLLGVAAGARLGARARSRVPLHLLPSAVVLTAACGALILRCTPALVGSGVGELLSLFQAAAGWLAAVLPAALFSGFAFPALARPHGNPGSAYALEALGAAVGGLGFSLMLAPLGTVVSLGAALAAAIMSLPRAMPVFVRIGGAALVVAASVTVNHRYLAATWRFTGHPGELRHSCETRHQRLELTAGTPATLFASGNLLASYPEPYTVAAPTHLALLLTPSPHNVMALGVLADGSFTRILRHPVTRLHLVELDPALGEVLPQWYGKEYASRLTDPRIVLHEGSVARALKHMEPLDLILMAAPPPSTLRENHVYSKEFFLRCGSRLAPRGVLVVRTGQKDTYLGGESGELLSILYRTLREAFPRVALLPADEVLLVAFRDSDCTVATPQQLQRRWMTRGIEDAAFHPAMIPILADPVRSAALCAELARAAPRAANSARRPSAILPAMALNEGLTSRLLYRLLGWTAHLPRREALLTAILGGLAFLALVHHPRTATPTLAVVIGSSSMGWWFMLMSGWQSTLGTAYAEIGALNALFMVGLAAGGHLARQGRLSARALPPMLAGSALLSLVIASGGGFVRVALSVPLLLAVGGLLTGLSFPLLVAQHRDRHHCSATGRIFAADELGAALAALAIGVFALPLIGVAGCASTLCALLGVSALAAWFEARRHRR